MSEQNGAQINRRWIMWVIGILVTIGLAMNGFTVNWVNASFKSHKTSGHENTVKVREFDDFRQEMREAQKEIRSDIKEILREIRGR